MDLIFVNVMLRTIGEALGINYLSIEVSWHMISTYQSITSMPYYLALAGQEDWLKEKVPTFEDMADGTWQKYTVKRYIKCFLNNGYTSYRVQRRPMEAYHMLKGRDRTQTTPVDERLKSMHRTFSGCS